MQAFSNIVEWFLLHFSLFLELPSISASKNTVIERKLWVYKETRSPRVTTTSRVSRTEVDL